MMSFLSDMFPIESVIQLLIRWPCGHVFLSENTKQVINYFIEILTTVPQGLHPI